MKRFVCLFALIFLASAAYGQTAASNKAFFVAGSNDLTVFGVNQWSNPVSVLSAPNAIKTSSNGALEAAVSAECALWTYTTVTATSNQGKSTGSARAAVKIWVEVDGNKATPEEVVYCDRYQAVGLDLTTTCQLFGVLGGSCTVTDVLTMDLFQRTKNANSFHFFLGPLSPTVHSVEVKASGIIECTSNGQPVACPAGTAKEFEGAKTAAVIGKRTLVLNEHNNWGSK